MSVPTLSLVNSVQPPRPGRSVPALCAVPVGEDDARLFVPDNVRFQPYFFYARDAHTHVIYKANKKDSNSRSVPPAAYRLREIIWVSI